MHHRISSPKIAKILAGIEEEQQRKAELQNYGSTAKRTGHAVIKKGEVR